jgi:hypothetical protein
MQFRPLSLAVLGALLLPAASATLSAQDFEGTFTAKVKGIGDATAYAKGNKARMEMTMAGIGAVVLIHDLAAGQTLMLMPATSMYMEMKTSDVEKMMGAQPGTDGSLTATGRKEQIAGHSCEVYRFKDSKNAMDVCLTSELGAFKAGAALFGGGPRPGRPSETPAWAREMARKGMLPLKVADTTGVPTFEVVTIEKRSVDDALFAPPANYTKMSSPFGRPPLD